TARADRPLAGRPQRRGRAWSRSGEVTAPSLSRAPACRLCLFRLYVRFPDELAIVLNLILELPLLGLACDGLHALPVKLLNHIRRCQSLRHLVAQTLGNCRRRIRGREDAEPGNDL